MYQEEGVRIIPSFLDFTTGKIDSFTEIRKKERGATFWAWFFFFFFLSEGEISLVLDTLYLRKYL